MRIDVNKRSTTFIHNINVALHYGTGKIYTCHYRFICYIRGIMYVRKIHPEADHPLSWLAENMQFLRRKHGLTRNDLAVKSGIPVNSIEKLEAGNPGISVNTFIMVLNAIDDFTRMTEILDIAADDIGLMNDRFELPERIGRKISALNDFDTSI